MRYILVPGACHGGWWYEDAVRALEAAGHHAQGVTLAGLAPDGRPVLRAHGRLRDDEWQAAWDARLVATRARLGEVLRERLAA